MQEVDLPAAVDLAEQINVDCQLAHDPDGSIYSQSGGIAMPSTAFIAPTARLSRFMPGEVRRGPQTIESELLE